MDRSYIGSLIKRLDDYHMKVVLRSRDKHQHADSLSRKKNYERLEEKQNNQAEKRWVFLFR